jgi:hypothetical protein
MKALASLAATVATAFGLLLGIFALHPFRGASALLDRAFGAPPAWTQVSAVLRDPKTQELSRGEAPLRSFATLAERWKTPGRRVLIIGNSQTMEISLAPGEERPTGVERTWTDLVTSELEAAPPGERSLAYRLSAPGMSYPEALWYVEYLALHPELRPDVLVLQINYQSFWNGGVRRGMLELLDDPAFAAAIAAEGRSGQPYAETFAVALADHAKHAASTRSDQADDPNQGGFGATAEASVRHQLDTIPGFHARHDQKEDLAEMLYRARIYVLRLKPSTSRSITGTRVVQARACLARILSFCREQHIRPVFFMAPVNPQVKLYRTDEDRQRLADAVREIEALGNIRVAPLESAIPPEMWGRQYNGPDPLHLGRKGHRWLAQLLLPEIVAALNYTGGSDGVQ